MNFNVTILGSNSALPTSERYPTAQVLNALERFFLIDCGEGTQIQLRKNRIRIGKINHIFISHLHGDHFYGLFGLISTMNLLGRTQDLHIYSPPGLKSILTHLHKSINEWIPYKIVYHEISSSESVLLFEDKKIEVYSIPLKHRVTCYGYLFKEKPLQANIKPGVIDVYGLGIKDILRAKNGEDIQLEDGRIISNDKLVEHKRQPRSYAFCSDTSFNETMIPIIKEVDLLYHEATFLEENRDLAKSTGHSTAREAAIIAKKAQAKQLIIGHFSSRYRDLTPLLEQARCEFESTELALEGSIFEIE